MKLFTYVSLPALVAGLIAGVNILTELTKKVAEIKRPERAALLWAELLGTGVALAAAWLEGWVSPAQLAAAVVCGLLLGAAVAYAAMFGYDELYERVVGLIGSIPGYLGKKG